jgi:hypothetical protein
MPLAALAHDPGVLLLLLLSRHSAVPAVAESHIQAPVSKAHTHLSKVL